LECFDFVDDEVAVQRGRVFQVRHNVWERDIDAEVEVEVDGTVGFGSGGYNARG
jgi:hypothetical protein